MTQETETKAPRDFGWVLLELMGHRQRVGKAQEEEIAGGIMLRIDVLVGADDYVTEYYGASSIYALRPISEEVARKRYAGSDPRPIRALDYQPSTRVDAVPTDDDDDLPNDHPY